MGEVLGNVMKISIVVPTRNRCEFLKYCLESCLVTDDAGIEVVVSDNNSVDDTRAVVAAFDDDRLKYVNPGHDLSMRQNFEFALSHATGDYVIFIGDDDGVLANGLATVRYLIERYQADIITWRHITYIWPAQEPTPTEGLLKFRSKDFCGPLVELDAPKILEDFCAGEKTNYRDGANIYHGCVSRKVIEKIQAHGGEYFQGQIPDVNTAISNLTVAQRYMWIRNPVTIAGEGSKSNGSAMNSTTKASQKQKSIVQNFTSLAAADEVEAEIDLRVRSIFAYTYANLDRVNQSYLDGKRQINHRVWRALIIEDMQKFPVEHRCWDVVEAFFEQMDPDYDRQGLAELNREKDAADAKATPGPISHKKKKKSLISTPHLTNVATVAAWLQTVTGAPYYPTLNVAGTVLKQAMRTVGMRMRAASLKE